MNRHALYGRGILSPLCLPISPPGHYSKEASTGFEPVNNGFANRP
ncbi:uncharacterized protein METZ01_LOCUS221972, partial [marine metagenome]